MKFHNITTDDMLNGDGLRTVLWVSGCGHHCKGCQNELTWDPNIGVDFTEESEKELFEKLEKDHISGITFSGGDPLFPANLDTILELIIKIRQNYPDKTIWLYSGFTFDHIYKHKDGNYIDYMRWNIVKRVDVFCDGKYIESLRSVPTPWVGSTNQLVIDIPKTLEYGQVVLYA